ncbi:MAG: sugar phosphate isomerase/epimerase [Verrucomicrobia bacterium]|nr:sugar phosphate isomerase/epimerase [Verrucomicrobiota bacterium]
MQNISRRQAVAQAGVLVGAAFSGVSISSRAAEATLPTANTGGSFVYCLNTATIRGQKLGIVKEIEVTAKAGYQAIEPWVGAIETYQKEGGSMPDLKRRIADLGISIESAIGFPQWIADDDAKRAQGLERARFEMDLIAQLGGKRLAAPPTGATDLPRLDLLKAAERYRALLDAGDQIGVVPQLELWGFSKNLSRLGECACVAIETGHPKACVLPDIYHLYKGGSDASSLRLLSRNAVHVLHMNDYPADPPREKIDDSYRVFPGDGVAPVTEILRILKENGGETVLSLELFHRKYWEMDPTEIARAGLEKMKAAVAKVMNR